MRPITVNMIPGGVTPVINVSQYDNNYDVPILLIEGTETYTPPTGATIRVEGTKPDGLGFEFPCTYQGNSVSVPIQTQMTVVKGRFPIELVVRQGDYRLGSCNLILAVEKAPLGEGTDISESALPDIIAGAQAQADAAAASATEAAGYRDESEEHKDDAAGSATEASGYKDLAAQSANRAAEIAADLATSAAVPNALFNKEATGNPIIIDDGVDDIPVRELITTFGPIQDLNGYSKPWPAGSGKNLIRNIKVQGNASTVTLGQSVATGRETYLPAGTWTFSYTSAKTCSIYYRDEAADAAARNIKWVDNAKSGTITLTEGTFIRVWAFLSSGISADEIESFQIEAGSTATDYEPYSNICPIEGRTGITVERAGKNLMTLHSAASQSTVQGVTFTPQHNNGTMLINGTAANIAYKGFTYTGKSNALDATRYHGMTLTGAVVCDNEHVKGAWTYYKQDGSYVNLVSGNVKTATFTVPDEAIGFRFLIAVDEGITLSNVEARLTLTLGTEPTYDPYLAQAYTVSWQTEAGTVYSGTLNLTTGKLTVDKILRQCDADSDFGKSSSTSIDEFYLRNSSDEQGISGVPYGAENIICSHAASFLTLSTTEVCTRLGGGGQARICFPLSMNINTLALFKTWLEEQVTAGTPLQFCYKLATPQTYQLTPEELKTLKGFNQIYSDGDSNSVKYLADAEESVSDVVADRWAIKNEVSGEIAAFSDAADDIPMKAVVVEITPVQDLNGQANPYPPGGGKNLLKMPTYAEISAASTVVSYKSITLQLSPNTTYYLSTKFLNGYTANGKGMYILLTNSATTNEPWVAVAHSGNENGRVDGKITTGTDGLLYLRFNGVTEDKLTQLYANSEIQLEIGSTATAYAPYSNICPISGRTGLTLKHGGKNLLNPALTSGLLSLTIGALETDVTSSGRYAYTERFPSTEDVILSIKSSEVARCEYAKIIQYVDGVVVAVATNVNMADTTTWHTKVMPGRPNSYCRLLIGGTTLSPTNSIYGEAQVEVGSTATEYEPYNATEIPITWETEAGTIYGGTLDVVSGVLTVDTILVNVASFAAENTNWSNDSTIAVSSNVTLTEPRDGTKMANAVSNHLINAKSLGIDTAVGGANITTPCFGFNANDAYPKYLYARFPKTVGTTLTEINAYLAQNPLTVAYAIQAPKTYQLTPKEVKSLLGDNTVYSDAGKVTVKYVADTKLYIDNKIAELQALILDNI